MRAGATIRLISILGILTAVTVCSPTLKTSVAQPPELEAAPELEATPELESASEAVEPEAEVIRFSWRPPDGPPMCYDLEDPLDQHRIVLFPGVKPGGTYPVVVGFHGTYKNKPPREYKFLRTVPGHVGTLIRDGEIRPVVLVLPAFRFRVLNWPGFDVVKFRAKVEGILKQRGLKASDWILFGHSGAAGCGGDGGLNQAWRLKPKVVGFFDTCLGRGWQKAVRELHRRKLDVVNIHTVETAGFRPKQRPEYQHTFDFGRAYAPLGMKPVKCPAHTPGTRLRDQEYRCAATPDGVVRAFVVDTGEGKAAHSAAVPVGIRYLLKEYVGVK